MNYSEFDDGLKQAEKTMNLADLWAERMAGLILSRLKLLKPSTLKKIKRELQNFNSTTGQWK